MVKANVDKILEYMQNKKAVSVSELAKKLSLKKDDVMKSAEYLEQDGVIKLDRKFSKTILTLLKKPEGEKKSNLPQPPVPPMPQQQPQPETLSKPPVQEKNNEMPKWPEPSSSKDQKLEWPGQEQNPVEQKAPEEPPKPPETEEQKEKPPVQEVKEEPKPELKEENLKQELKPKLEETKQKVKPAEVPSKEEPVPVKQPVDQLPKEVKEIPPEPVQEIEQHESPKPDMEIPLSNDEKEPFIMPENKEAESIPEPVVEKKEPIPEKPVLSGIQEISTEPELAYPETAKTDVEKIDFLLDEIDKRITSHKYDNLNQAYRQLYDLYQKGKLSPNERYLFSEKINDIFERIKNLHMIEETV